MNMYEIKNVGVPAMRDKDGRLFNGRTSLRFMGSKVITSHKL